MLGGEDGGEGAEDALGDEHHGVAAVLGAVRQGAHDAVGCF